MAPRARQAKSKARLQAYDAMLSESFDKRASALEIAIPPGPRLGDIVVEADDVRKAYGDRVLVDGLSFKLPRGAIVGVVGPNGAGKTTLFRMIVGQEKPDAGTLRVGDTVTPAYVDQSRDVLDARRTVSELSGGERNRLHLATMLKSGANLLLLDEPTNDLDVDTLRALEDALLDFAGCAVVISHDRWFLDRIATHILAFEGNSEVVWFEGNFKEYDADLRRRKGADADTPHRVTYKKLVRS